MLSRNTVTGQTVICVEAWLNIRQFYAAVICAKMLALS